MESQQTLFMLYTNTVDLSHLFKLKTIKEESYRQQISPNLSLKTPHKSKQHIVMWSESEITRIVQNSTFVILKNDSEV